MAARRNLERWQSWRDVIRRQEESGLSVAAFCREQQVPPASFFAWRKKLAEADQDENASQQAQVKFVPIELSPCTPSAANFEIVGPTGSRGVVPAQFEAESLRVILCVLQEI